MEELAQWQIDAIKVINQASDEFIEAIRNQADKYVKDVLEGEIDYSEITKDDVMEWLWESA